MDSKSTSADDRRYLNICLAWYCVGLVGCLLYILYLQALRHRVEARLDGLRAIGLPATAKELDAWYGDAPCGANAADVYRRAALTYKDPGQDPFEPMSGYEMCTPPLTNEKRAAMRQYLERNRQTLSTLEEAEMPYGFHDLDLTQGPDLELPHCRQMMDLSKLLYVQVLHAVESGRVDDALSSIQLMCTMAQTLYREPVLMSQFVGYSLEARLGRGVLR